MHAAARRWDMERKVALRRKRLVRFGVYLIGISLASVVLVLLGLHPPPAQRWVLTRVQQYLARERIDLRAGSLDYNLFSLSASIDHAIVRAAEFPDLPPFAQVGHADVSLSLADLIRGRYVVRTGNVADIDVDLVVEEDGRSNLPTPPQTSATQSSTKPTTPIDYLIERFTLSNGRLQHDDRQKHIYAMLAISSIRIAGDRLTRRHQVQLAAGGGELALQGRKVLRDLQLTAGVNYDAAGRTARLVSFDMTAPIGRIRADGLLALDPNAGESHLNADISSLDLLGLAQALELPYAAATQLDGQVRARWPAPELVRPTVAAKLSLAAKRVRHSPGVVPVEGNVAVSARDDVITAGLARVRAAATTVDGRVSLTGRRALGGVVHAK